MFVRALARLSKQQRISHRCFATNESRVLVDIDNHGVAHVQLHRPSKLNALDMDMFTGIVDAAKQLKNDKDLRCVIISGRGRAFCTGLDVKAVARNPANLETLLAPTASNRASNLAQDVAYTWRELPVPVICVMHGMAFGGGLQLALGADLRYSTPDCQLSIMEIKYGLIPDMTASVTLRELISIDVAKEWTFTGRRVRAAEAPPGIVTRVVDDPLLEAKQVAHEIASQSPDAIMLAKKMYNETYRQHTIDECLKKECAYQRNLLLGWNQLAASATSLTGVQVPYRKRQDDLTTKRKS